MEIIRDDHQKKKKRKKEKEFLWHRKKTLKKRGMNAVWEASLQMLFLWPELPYPSVFTGQ